MGEGACVAQRGRNRDEGALTVVASNYARVQNDLYQTEPWATRALLRHIRIGPGSVVWEPFAGNHLMADVLSETGADVITSDVATYDRPHTFQFDFAGDLCGVHSLLRRADALISNPPYGQQNRLAARFVRLALERCSGLVAMLLTAKFDSGKTRADLFADNPRFAFKLALVDRIQWFPGGDHENTEDHAWYVWEPAGLHLHRSPRLFYAGRDE